MVTLLFLIIAYAIRKKFLPEGVSRGDRMLYYLLSIVMTPLFGPWFFKNMIESKPCKDEEYESGRCLGTYPGFL